MNKFFHSLLALILVVVLCSWNGDDKLKELVKYLNSRCPHPITESLTMEGAKYANDNVTMEFIIHGDLFNFEAAHSNEQAFRDNFLVLLANYSDETFQNFTELLVEEKANLIFVMKNEKGDKYTMRFTNMELKKVSENTDKDSDALLQSILANTKLNLPRQTENGVVMTDALMENGYFTYVFTCDESIVDIDLLQASDARIKGMLKKRFLEKQDAGVQLMCEILKATNRGIAFKYEGSTSGKTYICRIESDELLSPPEADNDECKIVREGSMSVCVPNYLEAVQETDDYTTMIMVAEESGDGIYLFISTMEDWSAETILDNVVFENPQYNVVERFPVEKTTFLTYDARMARYTLREGEYLLHAVAVAFNDSKGEAFFVSVLSLGTPSLDNSIVNSFSVIK